MANSTDNSASGIVIGVLLTVLLGIGAFYFMNHGAGPSHDISINTPGGSITADVK